MFSSKIFFFFFLFVVLRFFEKYKYVLKRIKVIIYPTLNEF